MFGKSKTKQNNTETKELTVVEKELQRVIDERSKLDPTKDAAKYKTLTEIIGMLQDENLKVKNAEAKTIENENKSMEKKEKRKERVNKFVTALVQGALPVVGCAIIPIIEQHAPPMSKVFNPAVNSMFKHK